VVTVICILSMIHLPKQLPTCRQNAIVTVATTCSICTLNVCNVGDCQQDTTLGNVFDCPCDIVVGMTEDDHTFLMGYQMGGQHITVTKVLEETHNVTAMLAKTLDGIAMVTTKGKAILVLRFNRTMSAIKLAFHFQRYVIVTDVLFATSK